MRKSIFLFIVIACFAATISAAEGPQGVVNYHLGFENFEFIENDDFVHRSGLKTIEDRGLKLTDGRFGSAVVMTKPTRITELDEMTGTDLDLVTAVVFNTRHRRNDWDVYNEPVMWGAGKLTPESGALAFWIKGDIRAGCLFTQSAMAWGRKEKFLLSVTADEDGSLGAYIVDSRYVRHEIASTVRAAGSGWNHIVLNWNKAKGLELFLNGESVASSWGSDAWWMNPLPGLFHLPMSAAAYDELYICSRPLSSAEIGALMRDNTPPSGASGWSPGLAPHDVSDYDRLGDAFGLSHALTLPLARPSDGSRALRFREVTPVRVGDGHVPGRFCMDGRYELAWPHPIATFTIVPGDADFQAEKLDIETAPDDPYNYITIEGNFTGMPLALNNARKENNRYTGYPFFSIHQDERFFFAETVERKPHATFTLPFLKGYGAPGEFEGDVFLPLTGETRVHEVGLFDVTEETIASAAGEAVYWLEPGGSLPFRYDFTLRTMNPPSDRALLSGGTSQPSGTSAWMECARFARINLVTVPMTASSCVGSILLDLTVRTNNRDGLFAVRLRDPGAPHRIWTHAEVKLRGFDGDGGRLRLLLDPPPLMLVPGNVVWLDILSPDGMEIRTGGAGSPRIVLHPADSAASVEAYEMKALMPTMAEFTKAYHHTPWAFEDIWPDIDNPHTFGGQFDSVMPAMAVLRALPDSWLAGFYVEWAGPKYHWGSFVDPEKNFPIKDIPVPPGVPRWAHLQRIIQDLRWRIGDFLVANQNPDGQLWGGWNDDTLILRGRPDLPLDSGDRFRDLFLGVYEGLDRTNLFGKGFCQIRPIDNLHNGDFVRERFRALLYRIGDPYIYRRSLETAWHIDKPDQTPFNWGGGKPFEFDANMLRWYWGDNVPAKPYISPDWKVLDPQLSRLASWCDENLYHRFTDARVHTDASTIYNERYITNMILGGGADNTISVAWPDGGGPGLARWVTRADSVSLVCRMYSFDTGARDVTARLFRIGRGNYEITLSADNDGVPGEVIRSEKRELTRFDTFTVNVPPGRPVILTVRMLKKLKLADKLPDLAVASYDCDRRENRMSIRVSNFGDAPSKKTNLVVLDERGRRLYDVKVPAIEPPLDFVAKSVWIDVENLPRKGALTIVVDPKNKQREIFKENNTATIP